jgi:hypothetical protein
MVVRMLQERGPMTSRELARALGVPLNFARAKVCRAKQCGQVYIKEWRREIAGGMIRQYPRAVYAAGSGPDAPKLPRLPRVESNRAHRARKKGLVPASIFELALPVEHRRMTTRKRPDVAARHAAKREEKACK